MKAHMLTSSFPQLPIRVMHTVSVQEMESHLGAECREIAWWDSTMLSTSVEQLNDVHLHRAPISTCPKQKYLCSSFRLQVKMSTHDSNGGQSRKHT